MPPPPAEPLASRIFLGPALRAQPDRRLVKLVREGYEAAFEEIVRRYRKPLDRFAAAIVGSRSEDVTQDALSKALLALRGTTTEIELRPWLYRIVRNTALNDLRDGPPPTEQLGETIAGGRSAAIEAERREEITELMERLRALPEPQRAAIVMRELEGLSHEEIAAALGVSGGAARQAIYRARLALRNGLGLLIPLPLLRLLFDHGAEAAGGAVAAAGAASAAGGGAGATLGGLGAGGALKVGLATALVAGSVGAGVAAQSDRGDRSGPEPAAASAAQLPANDGGASGGGSSGGSGQAAPIASSKDRSHSGKGSGRDGDDERNEGPDDSRGHDSDDDSEGPSDDGSGSRGTSGNSGRGSGHGSGSGHRDDFNDDRSGEDVSGGHSGRGSSGSSGSGSSGSGRHGSGSDSESSGGSGESHDDDSHGGSGSSGSGSDGGDVTVTPPEPPPEESDDPEPDDSHGGSGSGSSGSGSGDDGDS